MPCPGAKFTDKRRFSVRDDTRWVVISPGSYEEILSRSPPCDDSVVGQRREPRTHNQTFEIAIPPMNQAASEYRNPTTPAATTKPTPRARRKRIGQAMATSRHSTESAL